MKSCLLKGMNSLKVLLVDQISNVTYKYSYSLAKELSNLGVEVTVVSESVNSKYGFHQIPLFNTSDKTISRINKFCNYMSSWKKIESMISDYDVLHIQWIIFSPYDYYIIKKLSKRIKIVMTIHDILPFNEKAYDYYYYKRIYSLVDHIVIQTENNVNIFRKRFPEITVPISVVYHGHFLDFTVNIDRQFALDKLGLKDKFYYLFFGQIKKVKGVDILLKAFAEITKNQEIKNNCRLIIAGEVWKSDYNKYEQIIHDTKIDDMVIQDIQFISDEYMELYYSVANVCVLPYREVYQSGILQMAYAHKKVPIVTNIPSFTSIVDESTGFVCDVNNVESLSQVMIKAYNMRDSLDDMAERGQKIIKEKYNWTSIANSFVRIYKELCSD